MEHTRTVTVTITVDPAEEIFSVETIEDESGCTTSFGPASLWMDWKRPLKEMIGDEIVSWVELISDEEDDDGLCEV